MCAVILSNTPNVNIVYNCHAISFSNSLSLHKNSINVKNYTKQYKSTDTKTVQERTRKFRIRLKLQTVKC